MKLVVPISVLLAAIAPGELDLEAALPRIRSSRSSVADHKVTVFGVVLLWHDLTILHRRGALAIALRVLLYRHAHRRVDARRGRRPAAARAQRCAGRIASSLVSWMIGISLSALAGILITPFEGGSLSATLLRCS